MQYANNEGNWLIFVASFPEGAVRRPRPVPPAPGRPVQEQSDLYLVSTTSASARLPVLSSTQIFCGLPFQVKEPK